jgi:E3 ubiquitin-protein ligase RGLG
VLDRYTEITPHVQLAGPTSFAPIIYEAISIVRQSKEYHILVIIADGQVTRFVPLILPLLLDCCMPND